MKNQSIAIMAILIAVAACGSKDKQAAVIATVGGRSVTQQEFDAYLALKRIAKDDAARSERALAEYLEREALADVIEQEKALDAAQVAAELREFEKELLISRYFDKVLADKVNDAAIRSYYNANAAKYEEKKVHVAHILVRTNPRMTEEERKAKLTAAQEVSSKLKAGEEFAKVATELSDDKVSAAKGGDLGWMREGSVDPRFSKQIFSMKQGELSEPFETNFGFHVVKLIEPAQTVKKPFEAVQGDIRYQLRAEAKRAETERLNAKLKVERKGGAAQGDKSGTAQPGSGLKEDATRATAQRE